MPFSHRHNLSLVIKRALKMPLSVILLSVGALFALMMHNLPGLFIFGLSITGVFFFVLSKLQDSDFIRAAIREDTNRRHAHEAESRVFRIEELDIESRVRMKTIVRLQNEIADDIASSPIDETAAGLADTLVQTEDIVDRALSLAQQKRELQRFLNKTDPTSIESRITDLQHRLESETDHARHSEIEIALGAKRRELDDYRAIEQAGVRIMGQLESIECSFAGLRARLVRIKSTDIKEWVSANEDLKVELVGLHTAVDTLEQSINESLQF
ncbi:hypothetical protein LLG46_13505 [bacterium]|nr:hypothetical protein [bacterium]